MSDKAIRDELAILREQVAALQSTRTDETSRQEDPGSDYAPQKNALPAAGEADRDPPPGDSEETQDTEEQIREFVNALEQEIKGTNPMTVLVVFSLGLLIGRLLPR